jgi:hypothetical protein
LHPRLDRQGAIGILSAMKRLVALLAAIFLAGCAQHYVITLRNGTRITTRSKPRLQRGNYVFKDADGKLMYVPDVRVSEIAPASMVKEEKELFKPSPLK